MLEGDVGSYRRIQDPLAVSDLLSFQISLLEIANRLFPRACSHGNLLAGKVPGGGRIERRSTEARNKCGPRDGAHSLQFTKSLSRGYERFKDEYHVTCLRSIAGVAMKAEVKAMELISKANRMVISPVGGILFMPRSLLCK